MAPAQTPLRRPSARRMRRARASQELLMIAPALALMTLFLVVPFLSSIWTSLTNQPLIPRPTPVKFVGLDNYTRILTDVDFWTAFWNVTRFTLLVLPIQCGFAFFTAMVLNSKLPARNFFRGMLFLPQITSMMVVCVIWGTIFQFPSGPLNEVIRTVSGGRLNPIDWLGDPQSAMLAIVVLSAWQAYGFQMIIYLAGLQGIPTELYDAAKMDGAGPVRRFWSVTMPSLRATHVFVLLITTIQAFKLYTQVAVLTQGGPRGSTNTIVHYMIDIGFSSQKLGRASAVGVILFLFVLFIALIQRRLLRRYDV
jgi:multiple sugar transport system permease protein